MTLTVAAVLDVILKMVLMIPALSTVYFKIVDSLHKTGELSESEWNARKAEYSVAMNGAAWQVEPNITIEPPAK